MIALELIPIINKLKNMIPFRIEQVFCYDNKIIIKVFSRIKDYNYIYIHLPKAMLLSTEKPNFESQLNHFCLTLRKYIKGKFVKNIEQLGTDKIIYFYFDDINMIFELIPPGNLIITKNNKIMLAYKYITKTKRKIIQGKEYIKFNNIKDVFNINFEDEIKKTDRKSIGTFLAMTLGLSGRYSNEICELSKINPNINPKELSDKEIKILEINTQKVIKNIINKDINDLFRENKELFNIKKENQEIIKLKNIIEQQIKEKQKFEEKIKQINKMIELIYLNYTQINEIINKLHDDYKKGIKHKSQYIKYKPKSIIIDLEHLKEIKENIN